MNHPFSAFFPRPDFASLPGGSAWPSEIDGLRAVVAIPARDEERRIQDCLAALAVQRDGCGAPLGPEIFSVVVLANNCRDATADVARALASRLPYRLTVVETPLPPDQAHAGGARRLVMDLAAEQLEADGFLDGVILTTDADTRAGSTWIAASLAAFRQGADAVAGWVDPDPAELLALGRGFGERGRNEDRYMRAITEIHALCDPRPHDPWPNHRVASGACLGVTRAAYRAIGGLPPLRVGEDAGLVRALECDGFRVRHSLAAMVVTSCRFDGRAAGGAADTMRLRFENLDLPCDSDMVPALRVLHRAAWCGRLRRLHTEGALATRLFWAERLGIAPPVARDLARWGEEQPFARFWMEIEARAPDRIGGPVLRPTELPAEIATARRIVLRLRQQRSMAQTRIAVAA